MIIVIIFSYILIGYICSLLYYKKCNEIDGKPIENKPLKAFLFFVIWPIIVIGVITLLPFIKHDMKKVNL